MRSFPFLAGEPAVLAVWDVCFRGLSLLEEHIRESSFVRHGCRLEVPAGTLVQDIRAVPDLAEIEGVHHIIGGGIASIQAWQVEDLFSKPQDTARLVLRMGHMGVAGII